MRIIAGAARSRVIQAPKGMDTRPTLDQVRESLFNILQARCEGARVLDLFAGSGALALEALSRGADYAVMCDIAPAAVAVIKSNAASLGFEERTAVLKGDWRKALCQLRRAGEAFSLVFLDPPYRMKDLTEVTQALLEGNLLMDDGLVIVEHEARAQVAVCPGLTLKDRRKYGVAGVSFYGKAS